ncbi:Sec-independent protein translocase protein TatB [Tepidamorphus sp. 3E244]|uniref:Sec-independent protein translocase protein TatB n=1 Tax=Tepidamorphus sp. 3E244 TaxID=3385498 RepID=UPI0038FCE0FB
MFDIGWTEMVVLAVVAILVVGPRELPRMLRSIGQIVGKLKQMSGEFKRQFNDALKEAELDDIKSSIDSAKSAIPKNPMKQGFDSLTKTGNEVKSAIETPSMANQKSTPPKPAASATTGSATPNAAGAAGTTAVATSSKAKVSASAADKKPATTTGTKAAAAKPAASKPAAKKPAATKKPAAAKPAAKATKTTSKPKRTSTAKTPASGAKS